VQVQNSYQSDWNKWSTRFGALKEMLPIMKEDLEALINIPNLLKEIVVLGEISDFHRKLGVQLQRNLNMFRDMEGMGYLQY
jgi:hypothetical protein